MSIEKIIISKIKESIAVYESILDNVEVMNQINEISRLLICGLKGKKKLLIAGNGGSAADAQHFAAELVSKFNFDRAALAAIALTTDTSILTSIANDYKYEYIFSRQLEALASTGDFFIGITTSGNSKNIIQALKYCKDNNIFSICLNGEDGGDIQHLKLADINLRLPSKVIPRVQEGHILIIHILCEIIEGAIFSCKQ